MKPMWGWLGLLLVVAGTGCTSVVTQVGSQTGTTSSSGTGGTSGLAAGSACTSNAQCSSQICGLDGTGNCCREACSTSDVLCGATACDAATGACTYPGASLACASCNENLLTAGACDGLGICVASGAAVACPDHLKCNAPGSDCLSACALSSDCVSGLYCADGGTCVPKVIAGACAENDACQSGVCGIAGTGHCCNSPCSDVAPPCGATDCNAATGACSFPGSSVACGPSASCTGTTRTYPGSCNGLGACLSSTADCTPYACGPIACRTSCEDGSSCAPGDFCDANELICCSGLESGGKIRVDSAMGSDFTACCGLGNNRPCQTLTHAMELIDSAQARDVTIAASVSGGGGDWSTTLETLPIVLGWGVELSAPGVTFSTSWKSLAHEVFDVAQYSANDLVGYASVVGTAGSPPVINLPDSINGISRDFGIQVEAGQTLYIANVRVLNEVAGLNVLSGAALVLGRDRSAGVTGTVLLGDPTVGGGSGIDCQGCVVNDTWLDGGSSLAILHQGIDIQAGDSSVITLTSMPILGTAPTEVGFNGCYKVDGAAVSLKGSATMTFKNGTVQCIGGDGFDLVASPSGGVPTLRIDNTIIQNTELAIFASAGTATVTNSTIRFNYNGVEQGVQGTIHTGTIDLGGVDGGPNTVICSSEIESISYRPYQTNNLAPGVCVLNASTATLNAGTVAWDTPGPDLFSCDTTLTSCTCEISSCMADAGSDGMDAVHESTGSIVTTGNTLSATSCAP